MAGYEVLIVADVDPEEAKDELMNSEAAGGSEFNALVKLTEQALHHEGYLHIEVRRMVGTVDGG